MSRCRCIDVHIFSLVQATPLEPVALKEVSSWMQSTKIQYSNSKTIFWQAFKGVCPYRIFPVASKPQARKNGVYSFACVFTLVQAMPLIMVAFGRRDILDARYENSAF
jgi:hypothetical protein